MPPVGPIQAIATPTIALLGIRAALPVFFRIIGTAGIRLGSNAVYDGLRTVLGLVALVLYFIWFARFYAWVRAARGGTSYSTLLAILGWFIPFANFVLPVLALNDAWKRANNGVGSPLPVLFWLSYLVSVGFVGFWAVYQANPSMITPGESSATLLNMLAWGNTLSQIVAYGLWAFIVKELTAKAK